MGTILTHTSSAVGGCKNDTQNNVKGAGVYSLVEVDDDKPPETRPRAPKLVFGASQMYRAGGHGFMYHCAVH